MYFVYNCNYKEKLNEYGLPVNAKLKGSLERLSRKIKMEVYKKYIDIFLNDNVLNSRLMIGIPFEDYELWNFNDIDNMISCLKNMSGYEFIRRILYGVDNIKRSIKEIEKITNQKECLINLIQTLPLADEYKWKLTDLICNIGLYKENYIKFIEYFYSEYIKERSKLSKLINGFSNYINDMTDKKKYIKSLLNTKIDIENCNVYLSTVFYADFYSYEKQNDSSVYIICGKSVSSITNGNGDETAVTFIFKNLGDETRFKILKELAKDNYITMSELSSRLNVSIHTISYHIDSLLTCKLISIKKLGNKSVYEINKDTISFCFEYLSKYLNLNKQKA